MYQVSGKGGKGNTRGGLEGGGGGGIKRGVEVRPYAPNCIWCCFVRYQVFGKELCW